MTVKRLLGWSLGNALGLGVGFVVMLQVSMLIEQGLDFERHWQFLPPDGALVTYLSRLGGALAGGFLFGLGQILASPRLRTRTIGWLSAATFGFALMMILIEGPLILTGLWGRIPGPVEPILITVGGCSLAGGLQLLILRREGIESMKWFVLWVAGLVASLLPAALMFASIEGAGVVLSWPVEVFLSGFPVAGVAALMSGRAFLDAIAPGGPRPATSDQPSPLMTG